MSEEFFYKKYLSYKNKYLLGGSKKNNIIKTLLGGGEYKDALKTMFENFYNIFKYLILHIKKKHYILKI